MRPSRTRRLGIDWIRLDMRLPYLLRARAGEGARVLTATLTDRERQLLMNVLFSTANSNA
jgi:hypothetical protein